ncbi:hypothetical protein L211DRAFT_29443 [Terfezia boudieri ATCC MYA-4762]|uniref:Uncharacterized protein n=1 Tax=Terfezia boudieri ATCC MYA-4762 TaxID=1051890 RepID=A0A3N4M7N1_9PEZI|nr:hypothetical protein L211DRAFT_29443 [Terfezia boudieri ATCC MYA-4762]
MFCASFTAAIARVAAAADSAVMAGILPLNITFYVIRFMVFKLAYSVLLWISNFFSLIITNMHLGTVHACSNHTNFSFRQTYCT